MFRFLRSPVAARDARRLSPAAEVSPSSYWQGVLAVADVIVETDTIKTLRLAAPGGAIPFEFLPGQYVDLTLDIGERVIHRSYSISSSAAEKSFIDLTIKREPSGLASRFLCDRVSLGDRLHVRGPFGQFTFAGEKKRRVILIGSGVGVTPLVGIIRTLRDRHWPGDIYACFGFRSEAHSLFVDELKAFKESGSRFRLFLTWSAPADRKTKPKGRLTAKSIRKFVRGLKSTEIFVCGPTAMMEGLQADLAKAGVPKRNIKVEAFAPPPSDPAKGGVFKVTFQPSGVSASSEPGESILETAERFGIPFDYSCRNGTCGLCRARLVAGEVELVFDDALDEDEMEMGIILTCQSFPRTGCIISSF